MSQFAKLPSDDGLDGLRHGGADAATPERLTRAIEILEAARRRPASDDSPWAGRDAYEARLATLALEPPLRFVLPGFPFKSPNADLVIGALPDEGERRAIRTLADLMRRVGDSLGVDTRLTVFSDGAVFNDVFEIPDATTKQYNAAIRELGAASGIEVVSLADFVDGPGDVAERRAAFLARYGRPIPLDAAGVPLEPAHRSKLGLFTRYVRDELAGRWLAESPAPSDEALSSRITGRALEVLARNLAYGAMIDDLFPDHARLSVHPGSGPDRLAVNLISATDGSETPWHNATLVRPDGSAELIAKRDALAQGLAIVNDDRGNPSHFTSPPG